MQHPPHPAPICPARNPAPRRAILLALLGIVALVGLTPQPAQAADTPDPASPPALEGRWGQLVVTVEISHIPMVGEVNTTNRALSLVDIRPSADDPNRLELRERLCALRFDSDNPAVETAVAPGFATTVPELLRHATLTRRGTTWRLTAPRTVSVHGATLKAPETDPLPKTPDDPRVVDADKDGHPGVTIEVRGMLSGHIRLVQRLWTQLRGIIKTPNRINGLVTWSRDQQILDATHLFLKTAPPREVHPDKTRHWFRLRRLPKGTTCDTLKAKADKLFKP